MELKAGSSELGAKSWKLGALITIPAGGCVAVPVSYRPKGAKGYFREWQTLRFIEETGRGSLVYFGVERVPTEGDFVGAPVVLRRLEGGGRVQAPAVNVEGIAQGPWQVFNGLEVARSADSSQLIASSSQLIASSSKLTAPSSQLAGLAAPRWRFSVAAANSDPEFEC